MADEREITAPFETEQLAEGWEGKAAPAVPQVDAVLRLGARTDLGQVRENNEDKFDFIEPEDPAVLARKGRIFAVADGMGGHSAGQIASELALKVFIRTYYADSSADVEASLVRAVQAANSYVVDVARAIPGRSGMGTTLTAAVVRDDDLFIAQVGDSRLYLLRSGAIQQITEDHSWVAEHVRRGTMTPEEAEVSPHRNVITRSLGGAPEVEPDIFAVKIEVGDRYLLCSDGLNGMVADAHLLEVGGAHSPSVAAWNLVELANEQGGKDNITVLILDVASLNPWPESEPATESAVPPEESPRLREAPPAAVAAPPPPPPKPASGGFVRRLFGRNA
jgi:protein phosphatase